VLDSSGFFGRHWGTGSAVVQRLCIEPHIGPAVDGSDEDAIASRIQERYGEALLPAHVLERVISNRANMLNTAFQDVQSITKLNLGPAHAFRQLGGSLRQMG